MTRRVLWIGAAFALVAAVALLALVWRPGPDSPRVVVGAVGDFPPGSVTPMDLDVSLSQFVPSVYEELGGDRARVPIFIVNHPQQGFLALHAFDPHQGCRVGLASELPSDIGVPLPEEVVFLNPCHGEKYDLGGGYMAGPAPRGLDRFGVSITDGRVIVDLTDFHHGPPR